MKKAVGIAAIALLLSGGGATAWADDQGQMDKNQKSQQPSSPSLDPNQRKLGGPRGDAEIGVDQPTKPVPDTPAPGYEGADKDKSGKSSTHGGPR
jgi:hypothetical protein